MFPKQKSEAYQLNDKFRRQRTKFGQTLKSYFDLLAMLLQAAYVKPIVCNVN